MDRPYVERLHIENYGCIQDATFALTPLHALIGPNDSGKSTVLRALGKLPYWGHASDPLRAKATVTATILKWKVVTSHNGLRLFHRGNPNGKDLNSISLSGEPELVQALAGTLLLRLDPDALRSPHALIPQRNSLRFEDERGKGLPAIYDAIMVRDLPAFLRLNEQISRLFLNVKSISLVNADDKTKAMGVKLIDGTFVPAELMSEGLLYYLAFAALPYLKPTAILLVEEPENGLHPARIAEVMRVLREISKTTQVLIATHSPLVINELLGDEVTVVTRTAEHGTKGTLMKDTPNFEERSKVYALGELWLSYANGEDEGPLLKGGPRP